LELIFGAVAAGIARKKNTQQIGRIVAKSFTKSKARR
jgi:hypothetical protein